MQPAAALKRVCVIDGQGGGIGSTIIRRLKETFSESIEIIALGANAIATAQMLKAHANRGASGENAIVRTVPTVDAVVGPIGIIMAHSMMGEISPRIAEAVAACRAPKLLLPLSQDQIHIIGAPTCSLPQMVEQLIHQHVVPIVEGSTPP